MERRWHPLQAGLQENVVGDNERLVHQGLWPVYQDRCIELQVHISIQPWSNIVGCLPMVFVNSMWASTIGPATSSLSSSLLVTGVGHRTLRLGSGSSSGWSSLCTIPNKTLGVKIHSIGNRITGTYLIYSRSMIDMYLEVHLIFWNQPWQLQACWHVH